MGHRQMDVFILLAALVLCCSVCEGALKVGVAKLDATLPVGVPLAGYNYPPRRVPYWPVPIFREYTTWMEPSEGVWNPTWVKAVVVDTGSERVAYVTLDAIGSDGDIQKMAHDIARLNGFTIPYEKCMFSASHTHSGPGAVSSSFLFSIAPATDLAIPKLQRKFAQSIAQAMVQAEKNMVPAKMDIGITNLVGVTHNRRAGYSPYVTDGTIDPHLGVIRFDTVDGKPLATIWNFAIHGICFDAPNLKISSDVMGAACDWIEANIGGTALFWNSDAGDNNPVFGVACQNPPNFSGGEVIGKAVAGLYKTLNPTSNVQLRTVAQEIDFGPTNLNLTLQRLDNCTSGGPLDICTFCFILGCDENYHLPSSWVEQVPMFSAFRYDINGVSTIIVSIPGEALVAVGWMIRNDTLKLGFNQTLLAGYSNSYLGYFSDPLEYDVGGYESILTFWGWDTSFKIRQAIYNVASQLAGKIENSDKSDSHHLISENTIIQ